MHDIKSLLAGGKYSVSQVAETEYPLFISKYPLKAYWFAQHGYVPHPFQAVFHAAQGPNDCIARFRHLVAGRRGGKTLSAAWEMLYYVLHPQAFHWDVHREEASKPLICWLLAKDSPTGQPSIDTFIDVIRQAGLVKGRDYTYNKTNKRFEFMASGSMIQFRTADDPQSLRGYGLDILWIDEAAFIPTRDAYIVTSPALTDKRGMVMTTTTPWGKNWLYTEFFTGAALEDPNEFRVQFTSLDNPFFSREEWERARLRMHPIMFKQEHLASFDAMEGVALQGEWLHYWVTGDPDPKTDDLSIAPYLDKDTGRYKMRIFMGIDPALSVRPEADHFALAVIGVTEDSQVFLLEAYMGKMEFPDQLDFIRSKQLQWRPDLIGIESNAFQLALAQQLQRLDTIAGIVPHLNTQKKNERILAMSPIFKVGKIRINSSMADFIDQWVSFDPEKKNQADDILDAVELAIRTAGVLLPMGPHHTLLEGEPKHNDGADVDSRHRENIREMMRPREMVDEHLGSYLFS